MRIATIAFPLLFCFVSGCGLPEGDPQRLYPGMPDYAAEALRARYKKDSLYSATDLNEKDAAMIKEHKEFYAKMASNMPAVQDARVMLSRALEYFGDKKDIIDVWIECRSGAQFTTDGTTPRDVLFGAMDVMRRLGIREEKAQSMRQFISLYSNWRAEDHLTHQQVLDLIVERRKFSN
jgi:hypothetical protein